MSNKTTKPIFRVAIDFNQDQFLDLYPFTDIDKTKFNFIGNFQLNQIKENNFIVFSVDTKNIYNIPYYFTIKSFNITNTLDPNYKETTIKYREPNFAVVHSDEIDNVIVEVEVFIGNKWIKIHDSVDSNLPIVVPRYSINNIPEGFENTSIGLGVTLIGGRYDSIDYTWTVNGGTLNNAKSATPIWTRPTSSSTDRNYTISLRMKFEGQGILVRSGTSVTRTINKSSRVLKVIATPSVTINNVSNGNEGTSVGLSATLTGGNYDSIDYNWSVNGGTLNDNTSSVPIWTRPFVANDRNFIISLTITVEKFNATATRSDTELTRVIDVPTPTAIAPTVTINNIRNGNEGTSVGLSAILVGGNYDSVSYEWSVNGGALSLGSINNKVLVAPTWTRPLVPNDRNFIISLVITAKKAGTTDTSYDTERTRVYNVASSIAVAPSVIIDNVPEGYENSSIDLSATLTGGKYSTVDYNWSVNGGTLNSSTSTTPTWTRPSVTADKDYIISLTITAKISGTTDTNSDTEVTKVLNSTISAAKAPDVNIDRVPFGYGGTSVGLSATLTGGNYDSIVYNWKVGEGTLNDNTLATPTWTRPSNRGSINVRITLTITATGKGIKAIDKTDDISSDIVFVRVIVAVAPNIRINNVPTGIGGTTVTLGVTLSSGVYSSLSYIWSVDAGVLNDNTLATPIWTRPGGPINPITGPIGTINVIISLTITAIVGPTSTSKTTSTTTSVTV